jgi:hypothetical protein
LAQEKPSGKDSAMEPLAWVLVENFSFNRSLCSFDDFEIVASV